MKIHVVVLVSLLAIDSTTTIDAQEFSASLFKIPSTLETSGLRGGPLINPASLDEFQEVGDVPMAKLSSIARAPFSEPTSGTRSAKDAQVYRAASPAVVLVVTKDGFGSGTLISSSGDIITNWHVVNGYSSVAVVYKPLAEGQAPTREDIKVGQVVRYDQVADLALLKAGVPPGKTPIRIGDGNEISIGADVHAIGHPTGEAWSYTKGVISQYRLGYEWGTKDEKLKHKADVIQTQTPINPGNSGGPLISDAGTLIGVNSFKAPGGEGLNFAVSVDDVKRFLTQRGNRVAPQQNAAPPDKGGCKPKEISRWRNEKNHSSVVGYDMGCTGKINGNYIVPDNKSEAILLSVDRNGDGRPDVIFFDFKRTKKWELSLWDENFDGHWTLVGYHDDGSLKPTRFESYDAFQRRLAKR
jgi:S1-C subfamily serine protease